MERTVSRAAAGLVSCPLHRLVVDRYAFQRIEKRGRCFHRLAVDRDPAVGDHPFDLAARGNAGARKQLCDALWLGMAGANDRAGWLSHAEAIGPGAPDWQAFGQKGGSSFGKNGCWINIYN